MKSYLVFQAKQHEKERKLQHFQEEVRRRVQRLERHKQQQQLQKSYNAVEVERNVVRQSAFAAERSTPRKNRCTLRSNAHLQIKQSGPPNTQGCIITNMDGDGGKMKSFDMHSSQVHKYSKQARRKLTSHRVMTEDYTTDNLPGGVWKEGPTLDYPASKQTLDTNVAVMEEEEIEGEEHFDVVKNKESRDLESRSVHFNFDHMTKNPRQERISRKSIQEVNGSHVDRSLPVPNIYPGVQSEEERVQTQMQRAMYRRLFMDIEREQVKENLRRQEHRRKISQLKQTKEEERRALEQQAQQLVEPDPEVTTDASAAYSLEKCEEERLQKYMQQRQRIAQKTQETERYLQALKVNLREKIGQKGIELPALCCCGETVWDTHPDTCANNCIFYKNPKMYAKALTSLLSSCDMA